jgi:hypothetical protein
MVNNYFLNFPLDVNQSPFGCKERIFFYLCTMVNF